MNLLPTIVAKSDQLNADDLVGGPRTITVTAVKGSDSPEQPVWIHFEGDDGKPFKPCKTCRRLLVHCWGPEASDFIGRRMTLYTDPNVMFGGVKTGGIRISHVSHIERELAVALMITRGKRASYTVKPLRAETSSLPAGRREARRDEARRTPERRDEGRGADDDYTRGFGQGEDAGDEEVSDAVQWMRGVFEDLDGDAFRSTADLDGFFGNPDNIAKFEALKSEDPALATRLEAALRGRGKALASRRG